MHRRYRPRPPTSTDYRNWLNPRRQLNVDRLLSHLAWHGGKLFLDAEQYGELRADFGIERHAVDLAADDAYALGYIDMRLGRNDMMVLNTVPSELRKAVG